MLEKPFLNPILTLTEYKSFQELEKTQGKTINMDAQFSRLSLSNVPFQSSSYQRKNDSNVHCSYNISFKCRKHQGKC